MVSRTVDLDAADLFFDFFSQIITQLTAVRPMVLQISLSHFCRLAESHDTGNIFSTGSPLGFLCTAVHEVRDLDSLSRIECTNALRTVDLVSRHGHEVDSQILYIDGHVTQTLYSVCMEIYLMFLRNSSQFLDRFYRSDFVVHHHDTDKDRIITDRILQHFRLHETFAVYIQISHLKAVLFQIFACMQDRVVLDLACNDMFSLFFQLVRNTFQNPVIRFCST